jgi:hypothetical protein
MRVNASMIPIAGALLATLACGAPPDFYVHGAGVILDTAAPFARRPDFPERLEGVLSVALGYWGGDWRDLRGRTITFSAGPYVSCAGSDHAVGCFDGDVRVATSEPLTGFLPCVEQTVLIHEIGHAVIGDRAHEDPRWMQFEPVQDALDGRAGYTATGEVECVIFTSVWRHPLHVL